MAAEFCNALWVPVAGPSRRAQLDGLQHQSSDGGWLEEEVVHSRGAACQLEVAGAGVQVHPGVVCNKDRAGLSCQAVLATVGRCSSLSLQQGCNRSQLHKCGGVLEAVRAEMQCMQSLFAAGRHMRISGGTG